MLNPDSFEGFRCTARALSEGFLAARPGQLGMTLYLEWSSVELRNMVSLHQHLGLDPHFYELRVGIDNAASGHGAMTRAGGPALPGAGAGRRL
ncbi:MAG: hypothetical protein H0T85_09710 [Geodermatophilaceae bacterium]|nr:hypothetical protein [Geodermatophilaceae bacterium]